MVSIIMPTYNRGYIIQKAIDSVLAQTYEDWELIIVDDGSTDNTAEVVGRNNDERIRYISYSPNKGANHARNVGMENAAGDFIAFADSDIIYEPKFLELFSTILNDDYVDIVWGRGKFVQNNNSEAVFPDEPIETLNDYQTL